MTDRSGHEVRIFLLGEAVGLMRRSVADAVVPVGWPPVGELLGKVAARKIPKIFVSLVEWADRVITE